MEKINQKIIAPCGMNCGVCVAHLRKNNQCPGCNNEPNLFSRQNCALRLCQERNGKYCFECKKFPCAKLKQLDKRYREKYGMSEIENLEFIRDKGINKFIKKEQKKWQSAKGILCVHNRNYY